MNEFDTNKEIGDANKEVEGPRLNSTLLAVGIGMALLGCLLFFDKLDHSPLRVNPMRMWPVIIVAIGIAKLVEYRCRRLGGWIITILGALLLWHGISGKSFSELMGPCIIITVGVLMVLSARKRRRRHRLPMVSQREGDFAQGTAILGGYKYKPNGGEFCGGDITAIFGGFQIDLGRMTMKSDSAQIEVFAMFGGGEIRVPDGWNVSVQAPAFVGGVEDDTLSPLPLEGRSPKLLVITGSILFGGVTVKTCPRT
jgi:predicted membrane protein